MKKIILSAMIGASALILMLSGSSAFAQYADPSTRGTPGTFSAIWANGCEYLYYNGNLIKKTCSKPSLKTPPNYHYPTPSQNDAYYGE